MERSRWFTSITLLIACVAAGCSSKAPPASATAHSSPPDVATEPYSGGHVVVRPLDTDRPPPTSKGGAYLPESQPSTGSTSPAPDPSIEPVGPNTATVDSLFNPLRMEEVHVPIRSAPLVAANPLRVRSLAGFADSPLRSASSYSPAADEFPVGESASPAAIRDAPPATVLSEDSPEAVLPQTAPLEEAPREAVPATTAPPAATAEPVASPTFAQPPPPLAAADPPPTAAPRSSLPKTALPKTALPKTAAPQSIHSSMTAGAPATGKPAAGALDVVQVFYATDRRAIETSGMSLTAQLPRYLPTAISVLVTLALALVALGKRRPAVLFLAGLGVLISVGLGYQAASGTLAAVRRSGHSGPQYTSDRSESGQVQLGICEVSIPKTHTIGELESPSILRLEIKPDADKHVILSKTERLADDRFYNLLRERVAASPRKELFVFVHGFNVTFEDAARRTAQIQKDLSYEGAPIFFSWPAHDKFILTYKADEANVSWSASHLKKFLLDVTRESNAQSINLIAHSMGNRALTAALKELQLELRDQSRLFNQVILAAPDIDAGEFRESIVPGMTRTANRFTLYASARDEALAASQLVHRGARAGDAGRGLVVVEGIDTIDVTQIDTSAFGHTYYGSSDPVLRDLGLLLTRAVPPEQRVWLAAAKLDGRPYWVFQPTTATARLPSDPGSSR